MREQKNIEKKQKREKLAMQRQAYSAKESQKIIEQKKN